MLHQDRHELVSGYYASLLVLFGGFVHEVVGEQDDVVSFLLFQICGQLRHQLILDKLVRSLRMSGLSWIRLGFLLGFILDAKDLAWGGFLGWRIVLSGAIFNAFILIFLR